MSSVSQNNIVRSVAPKSIFESAKKVISSSSTWNQGDLLYFDTGNHIINALAATGNAATLLGVAKQKITSGKVASPYTGTAVDASQAIEDIAGPSYGIVAFFTLTTGDTINPGDKVYATATDPQTVTVTDPSDGNYVGIYQGKAITSAAAGTKIDVLVGCRFGGNTGDIQF